MTTVGVMTAAGDKYQKSEISKTNQCFLIPDI
jgi:hypothetical protein